MIILLITQSCVPSLRLMGPLHIGTCGPCQSQSHGQPSLHLTSRWISLLGLPLTSTKSCGAPKKSKPNPTLPTNGIFRCKAEAKGPNPCLGKDGPHHQGKAVPVTSSLPFMDIVFSTADGFANCAECITTIDGHSPTMEQPQVINCCMVACSGEASSKRLDFPTLSKSGGCHDNALDFRTLDLCLCIHPPQMLHANCVKPFLAKSVP